MKWLFLLLLIVNLAYLGWEMDRSAGIERKVKQQQIRIPADTPRLALVSELSNPPEPRDVQTDDNDNQINPMLSIEMNPNTEKMIDTLLNDSAVMQMDNVFLNDSFDVAEEQVSDVSADDSACYTYGPIPDSNESALMTNWLNDRGIFFHSRQTREDGKQLFWVYLAPQKSQKEAEAAMQDLKKQGVNDLRLIQTRDLLNAISLGLFSSQAAVNRRLNEIQAKGYQTVVIPYSGSNQIHWFYVRIVKSASYVNELFTGFPARFNAVPVDCNQIAMLSGNP